MPYDAERLVNDPLYNAGLGTAYLARMLDYYDGSYLLAAAAYNAGPGRVDEWLEELGDPRQPGTDPVGWIEEIPFTETRNYVMRVLEALHVYRARLNGRAEPVRIVADITPDGVRLGGRRYAARRAIREWRGLKPRAAGRRCERRGHGHLDPPVASADQRGAADADGDDGAALRPCARRRMLARGRT